MRVCHVSNLPDGVLARFSYKVGYSRYPERLPAPSNHPLNHCCWSPRHWMPCVLDDMCRGDTIARVCAATINEQPLERGLDTFYWFLLHIQSPAYPIPWYFCSWKFWSLPTPSASALGHPTTNSKTKSRSRAAHRRLPEAWQLLGDLVVAWIRTLSYTVVYPILSYCILLYTVAYGCFFLTTIMNNHQACKS